MASAIDPSKPGDGVPASKADLRANLQAAKTELDHGGFAEGFTPSNYGPPASARVKDHLAALDALIPTLGGGGGLTGSTDVKASFGAAGNGSTDDTAAIQSALQSGASVVYFPAGTYRVTAQLNVTPGTKLLGVSPGLTIIDGRAVTGGANGVFKCTGAAITLPSLASAITKGEGTITFNSSVASSLAHGDWVRIRDDTTNSMSNDGGNDGFACMVKAVQGATLYPAALNLRNLPAPLTGGPVSNLTVRKLDRRGMILRDITVRGSGYGFGPNDGAVSGSCVYLLELANVYIENCNLEAAGTVGVRMEQSANIHIDHCVIGTHTGDISATAHYGAEFRGTAYSYLSNSDLEGQRSSIDMSNRFGPSHNNVVSNCNVGGPGTNIFSAPTGNTTIAFGHHTGNFNNKFIGCHVQGRVVFEGSEGTELLYCTVVGGFGQAIALIDITGPQGPVLDLRIVGCRLFPVLVGSSGGVAVRMGAWAQQSAGGSLVIADNDIYVLVNTSEPLIRLDETTVKSPAAGVIHIVNNRVGYKEGATSQPFCNVNFTDGLELVVTGNVLPANMTLGTFGTDFTRRVLSPNVVGGHVVYTALPTSTPGGSGRLWSDAGRLRIT